MVLRAVNAAALMLREGPRGRWTYALLCPCVVMGFPLHYNPITELIEKVCDVCAHLLDCERHG